MELIYVDNKPVLKGTINGSKVTVCFADKPNPKVKDNIIEILTSCFEQKVQESWNDIIK